MRLSSISGEGKSKTKRQLAATAKSIIRALSIPEVQLEDANHREIAKSPTEQLWLGQTQASKDFLRWLKEYDIDTPIGKIPTFAEGGDGRAYFLGKYVVKFTRDKAGANIANMCIGTPRAPAPVVAVKQIPNSRIWAIILLKVHPDKVPANIKLASDYLMAWIDDHPDTESFPTDQSGQEEVANLIVRELGAPSQIIPSIITMMNVHNRLYFSTGFSHTDGGPSNISMLKGTGDEDDQVVYHDLGPNVTSGYDPDKEISKIKNNRKKLNLPDIKEV